MGTRESTALTREIGEGLKQVRKAAGMLGHELATKMQWPASKVSRIETGQRAADEVDIVFYLAHCGAKKEDLDRLLPLCRDVDRGFWMQKQLRSLVFHESTARGAYTYEPLVVPGLLQTEDYARALIRQSGLGSNDVECAVSTRMRRQHILHDYWSPLEAAFFLHEHVLRLAVGGNRVMNEQLLNLVLLADQPNISVRVVPAALGERSYFGPPFCIFEYRHHKPLVHEENAVDGLFIEDTEYVYRYQHRVARITETALDEGQSRVLLATVASEYDRLDTDAPDHLAEEQL
jgi:transcriptional regulator with XRE-family HTH domain